MASWDEVLHSTQRSLTSITLRGSQFHQQKEQSNRPFYEQLVITLKKPNSFDSSNERLSVFEALKTSPTNLQYDMVALCSYRTIIALASWLGVDSIEDFLRIRYPHGKYNFPSCSFMHVTARFPSRAYGAPCSQLSVLPISKMAIYIKVKENSPLPPFLVSSSFDTFFASSSKVYTKRLWGQAVAYICWAKKNLHVEILQNGDKLPL